jgi:RNA polymerase sigma-70 factor (ECF subfamily)
MSAEHLHDELIETAYAEHAARLFRRAQAITHDPASADEVVQETFTSLIVEVRAGRIPTNVGGWLGRVAFNHAISQGRRATVARRALPELIDRREVASPETVLLRAEADRATRVALDSLRETDRAALVLAAQGWDSRAIGTRIGRSEGATRTLICRARAKLRARMTFDAA